jgi:hypothetical protein
VSFSAIFFIAVLCATNHPPNRLQRHHARLLAVGHSTSGVVFSAAAVNDDFRPHSQVPGDSVALWTGELQMLLGGSVSLQRTQFVVLSSLFFSSCLSVGVIAVVT